MATAGDYGLEDPQDPYGTGTTDWWTQNAPAPAPSPENHGPDEAAWNETHFYTDSPGPGYDNYGRPIAVAPTQNNPEPGVTTTTGGDGGGGGTAPPPVGVPTSGFGAAPAPYASDPNAPSYTPMPTYVAPTWQGGDFQNPTEQDLYNSPGYGARLKMGLQGRERSAAAQGTILSGGTQKALERYGQDYATNEYQTLRNNSYDAYVQKYKQFTDRAGMDLAARTANANENQNTFANRALTYTQGNTRTLSDYLTNLTAKRNSELDYWNRLNDVSGAGSSLAGGSYR